MKSSRARRILGLLAENSTPDCENTITSPDYELEYEKPNNSNMNSNNEVSTYLINNYCYCRLQIPIFKCLIYKTAICLPITPLHK